MKALKKKVEKKTGKSWGVGGSTIDPLEWKFQGGGGFKLNDHPWGGYGYFLESHIRTAGGG